MDILIKRKFYGRSGKYCISSGVSVSIKDIVDILKSCSNSSFEIKIAPENKLEVKRINTDNKSLRSYINWQPKISVVDGLHMTYDWFADNLNRRK